MGYPHGHNCLIEPATLEEALNALQPRPLLVPPLVVMMQQRTRVRGGKQVSTESYGRLFDSGMGGPIITDRFGHPLCHRVPRRAWAAGDISHLTLTQHEGEWARAVASAAEAADIDVNFGHPASCDFVTPCPEAHNASTPRLARLPASGPLSPSPRSSTNMQPLVGSRS